MKHKCWPVLPMWEGVNLMLLGANTIHWSLAHPCSTSLPPLPCSIL